MTTHQSYRFDEFELDVDAYELRHQGRIVRLEPRAMEVLLLMVERPHRLITRAEIAERVWGDGVFVDVDTGVNTLVWKVRQALRDSSDAPRFIETVARKGYRFIAALDAPVQEAATLPPAAEPRSEQGDAPQPMIAPPWTSQLRSGRLLVVGGTLTLLLAAAVYWSIAPAARPTQITIGVLPFENLSGDPERDYLADGLSEEMISTLGQVDPTRLRVIGRTSMMRFKGSRRSVAEIGRDVGADYLVESSIRAEGARLRITSTLIIVDGQAQVWSRSFDRESTSLLGVQRDISTSIAEQIKLTLTANRASALTRRETRDPAAYDLYLRGRYFANQRSPAANARAIDYLIRATERDPQFALAWAALAETYASSPVNGDADPADAAVAARQATERAITADAALAEAQNAVANVNFWFSWNWRDAELAARRAVDLDPNYPRGHLMLAVVLSHLRRFDEATRAITRAVTLDPLDPINHVVASEVAFRARDPRTALEHASRTLVFGPEFWIGYMMKAQAYEQTGDRDAALRDLIDAARFSDNNSKVLSLRGYILAKMSRQSEAREVLAALQATAAVRYLPPYAIALVHAGLGETNEAFAWLDRAYAARDVHLVFLTVDPKWDAFREEPRFRQLLARCGFPAAD